MDKELREILMEHPPSIAEDSGQPEWTTGELDKVVKLIKSLILSKAPKEKGSFENYLCEKHAEQYVGTKDCMVDDFEKWLSELDIDDYLIYGEMFGNDCRDELLKNLGLEG